MKILLTESKLKEFIKNKFGVDLTGKIDLIQSFEDLPSYAKEDFNKSVFNHYLNRHGPMFGIKIGDNYFTIQRQRFEHDNFTYIIKLPEDINTTEDEFLELLGLDRLGIPLMDIIEIYFKE